MFDFLKRKKRPALTQEQLKWNKMWSLWDEGKASSPYSELMRYQSEINNGGHDQYFTNVENTGGLAKELSVLESALSAPMKENLRKAYKAYLILEEADDDEEAENVLDLCDDFFYTNESEINQTLEAYAATISL